MISAAVLCHTNGLGGYLVAALLLVLALPPGRFAPMLLLSIWIAAVSVMLWRHATPIPLGHP